MVLARAFPPARLLHSTFGSQKKKKNFIFQMKQNIRTSELEEIFLYVFTTVKVCFTFLESMMM